MMSRQSCGFLTRDWGLLPRLPSASFESTVHPVAASEKPCRLFIYGTLLPGERDHALLSAAEHLGPASTEPAFQLVEVGAYAALVADGKVSVHGELYATDLQTRRQIDIARQVPILFQRVPISLADGTTVEAYVMTAEQVRGKRRLAHGDWRTRFAPPAPRRAGGAFVKWSRTRFDK
jgi:gamma-glutamylcyclotransferase (GGCT)/AIG2-like uncharacterized protein YtfP